MGLLGEAEEKGNAYNTREVGDNKISYIFYKFSEVNHGKRKYGKSICESKQEMCWQAEKAV